MAKTQNVYFPNRAAVADTWRSCHAHNLRSLHGWLQFTCDYIEGEHAPHYPVPALLVDSVSNLGVRWSNWLDTMAEHGKRI